MKDKSSKILYLGVEGGATKSAAVLTDENLNILEEKQGKALNYHSLNKNAVERNLKALIDTFKKRFEGSKLKAVFGLASVDTLKDEIFYNKLISSVLPKGVEFKVVNDTRIALEATCLGKKNRIIVIAGTGSNVYGENGKEHANAIGWDLLGDEGSGYYFGLKALQAVAKAFDGRIEKTELTNLVLDSEKSKSFEDFLPLFFEKVMGEQGAKYYVGSFAPLVDRAVEKGDKEAIKIRDEGARELAFGVYTVAKKLGFDDKNFCLGLNGSQWKMPGLKEVFIEEVLKLCPKAEVSASDKSGVWGAILLAQNMKSET